MKITHILCLTIALLSGPSSADAKAVDPAPIKPMKAGYSIYSGEIGDERAPTTTDRKLSVEVSGQAAKDIFESIYPDAKVTCSDEKGQRLRRKGQLWCSFSPAAGYQCYLGFNLRTGASTGGASC